MKLTLTEQQGRALELFSNGLTIQEIALSLGVSYQRALTVLNSILLKTEFKNRRELLANAKSLEIVVK